ncbi:MAG: sugar ABC transporter substrate-binding protein [Propionibacteriaceae bacterium]|nr:sugar ABC transporter substrate-binding protein [Propionibacteriaceae bacterium]
MKNNVVLALVAATSLALAACTGPAQPPAPGNPGASPDTTAAQPAPADLTGSVTMWYPPIGGDIERAYWDGMIEKFNAEYPNVDVNVEIIPWDSRGERLQTAIAGRQTPDVTYALPADIFSWSANGLLTEVDDVIAEDRDKFLPNAIDTMSTDGKLYGVPILVGLTSTVHVKPVWDDMGVAEADYPKTWDEVREWAPKLKEKGYYVTQYDAAPTMTLNGSFYPLLWSAGGTVLNEEGTEATLNGPEGLKALEFAKWLVDNEYTPKDALTQALPVETSPIAAKKVAMLFARSTASLVQHGLSMDELVIARPLADAKPASYGNVAGYVVFKSAEHPEAAKAWIDFISDPEELREFLPERKQHSARSDITDLFPEGSPDAVLAQYLDDGVTEPRSPKATEIMNLIKPHVQSALLGQTEPQAALDAAAQDIDAALARP